MESQEERKNDEPTTTTETKEAHAQVASEAKLLPEVQVNELAERGHGPALLRLRLGHLRRVRRAWIDEQPVFGLSRAFPSEGRRGREIGKDGVIMKAIGKALERVKSSRIYYKLFVAQIDHEKVEEMKTEMRLKYHRTGLL